MQFVFSVQWSLDLKKKPIIFIASDIQLFPIKIGPQHKKSVGRGNMYTYYRKHSIQSIQQQQQQIWRKQIIFTFQIFKISEIEPLLEPFSE